MKFSEIAAKVETLAQQVAALVGATKLTHITAEQHAALDAKAENLAAHLSALKKDLGEAVAAEATAKAASDQTISGLQAQVTQLNKNLADKQALAAHGAASAAELAAGQTVAAVPAGTDADADGPVTEAKLRLKASTETDPRKKGLLMKQLRSMKGIGFESTLEPAKKS